VSGAQQQKSLEPKAEGIANEVSGFAGVWSEVV